MTFSILVDYWQAGFGYSVIGFSIISLLFGIMRWHHCVSNYIETGHLDEAEYSWFFGDSNWIISGGSRFRYGNHPWVVACDIFVIIFAGCVVSIVWPISLIVIFVVLYAIIARARFKKKKEFIEKLSGTNS